jgi:hypothetical protein
MTEFNRNTMLSAKDSVMDMANAITLRQDLHSAFDARRFVFTKKRNKWVAHFLTQTLDQGPSYHNQLIPFQEIAPEFLLVRLAWAIFPFVSNFLPPLQHRAVLIRQ